MKNTSPTDWSNINICYVLFRFFEDRVVGLLKC